MRLPRAWTDADGAPSRTCEPDAVFSVDAIRALLEVVEALQRRMPEPQAAILGCTHYPLVEEVFRDALGPDVQVYSQANLVAESLADYLKRRPEMLGSCTASKHLTTGDPKRVGAKATQFLRRAVPFEAAFPEE